jgi:hypothetical protein
MLSLFTKKRLSDNKMANMFVNVILDATEDGFKEVAAMINDDPEFVNRPSIQEGDYGKFMMIVLVANLNYLPEHFDVAEEKRLRYLILDKFARQFEMDYDPFKKLIQEYKACMARVNHPSKNHLYAMSRMLFNRYNLNDYQEEYFKNLSTPNPIFLKRMDEVMTHFIWDWATYLNKYKVQVTV